MKKHTIEHRRDAASALVKETVTIWHVIVRYTTLTFLDYSMMMDFIGKFDVTMVEDQIVMTESEVTYDEYDRLSEWAGAIT